MDSVKIKQILVDCWDIASEVDLKGIPPGIINKTEDGKDIVQHARWQTYFYLLAAYLPKQVQSTAELIEPKEDWQR